MNWLRKASSVQGFAMASVSPEASTTMVAMVPSAFRVTVTFTLDSRPLAEATSSAGVSTASATPMAALAAFTTASEVTVAPDRASMPSPRSGVAFLPMN